MKPSSLAPLLAPALIALLSWSPSKISPTLLAEGAVTSPSARQQDASSEGWRPLEGTWTATGQRRALAADAQRTASTAYLSGALVLGAGSGTSRGFQSEVITFDDGAGVSVGRAVWTDERGDRIFSRLTGDLRLARRRILGTITGGTGRYAGIEGDYAFEWQFVVQAEDGTIQGNAVDLKGRVRLKGAAR
jgi:hypothetical protein